MTTSSSTPWYKSALNSAINAEKNAFVTLGTGGSVAQATASGVSSDVGSLSSTVASSLPWGKYLFIGFGGVVMIVGLIMAGTSEARKSISIKLGKELQK